MATPESFTLDIDAFIAKTRGRLKQFATEFVQDIGQKVVEATPVKTGFLRGSWFAQLNAEPGGTGSPDPSGAGAVSGINLIAASLTLGDIIYFNNGASYGIYLEYGTRYIAPRAFVRGTIDQAEIIAEEAAQRVAGAE